MRRALVFVVTIACSASKQLTLVQATPQPIPPPVAFPHLCKRVNDDIHAKVEAAIARAKKDEPAPWKDAEVEPEVRAVLLDPSRKIGFACHAFPRGAWALEPVTIDIKPHLRSAYVDLVPVVYLGMSRFAFNERIQGGTVRDFTRVHSQLASDYDGDGIPELYVRTDQDVLEGGHNEESHLFTFDGNDVNRYAPARNLGLLGIPQDVDSDGLLDFSATLEIFLGEGKVCHGGGDWRPARLLAHAKKDGSFSMDDDVAKSYAKTWCSAAPTTVASSEQALCARLWKQPRALVTSSCVPWSCDLENQGKPQPKGATRDCQDRISAYDSTVPFTLP